eukprot:2918247-Rhodomonas_salina.1
MTFSWRASDEPDSEIEVAATPAAVLKRWTSTAQDLLCASPQVIDTIAGRFLTAPGQGRQLLA